jgi:hypothetical protein
MVGDAKACNQLNLILRVAAESGLSVEQELLQRTGRVEPSLAPFERLAAGRVETRASRVTRADLSVIRSFAVIAAEGRVPQAKEDHERRQSTS